MKHQLNAGPAKILDRVLLHAITALGETPLRDAILEEYRRDQGVELTLAINGHPVNLKAWIEALVERFDQEVLETAEDLVRKRVGDAVFRIDEAASRVISDMRAQLEGSAFPDVEATRMRLRGAFYELFPDAFSDSLTNDKADAIARAVRGASL